MRKTRRLLPFILSLMLLSSCGTPGSSSSAYRQISMDEAVTMMKEEKNYIILDVRRPDEYAEGHIPGAINVPNEEIDTAEIASREENRARSIFTADARLFPEMGCGTGDSDFFRNRAKTVFNIPLSHALSGTNRTFHSKTSLF